ncbi:SemiSWEET family sugar transporter [Aquimarina sp. LLG6339-5]|uniref:SemiSWEET family sugar transporter n=1 Tax=Aquimarina sp. LLG6339-5 TaxID=3160830 RepID=UPI0038704E1A
MNIPIAELLGFIAAALSSCSFIPQVYRVYRTKSVKSISWYMLAISIVAGTLWLTYGFYLENTILILSSGITCSLHVSLAYFKFKFRTPFQKYSGY